MEQVENKPGDEQVADSVPINNDPPITVYQADANRVYVGTTTADASPLEENTWLIPAGCVTFAPVGTLAPKQAFQLSVDLTQWLIVEDHRGTIYWLADRSQHVVENVGALPPGALLEEPPVPPLTEAEQRTIATATKSTMLATATLQIAILTDATDPDVVEEVDPADTALLIQWKAHRVLVNKIKPATDALPIVWPTPPLVP